MLVVAAMAIVPRMGRSVEQRGLAEAAYRLEKTALTAHELAIARRQACALDLDLDSGGYGVGMVSSSGEVTPVQASWLKQERLPEGVRFGRVRLLDGSEVAGEPQRVWFRPDGTSNGAIVQLVTPSGEHFVAINPQDGRATAGASVAEIEATEPTDLGD